MAAPGFWDDRETAAETTSQLKALNRSLKPMEKLDAEITANARAPWTTE